MTISDGFAVQVAVVLPLSETGPNYWQTVRRFGTKAEAEAHVRSLKHPAHYRIVPNGVARF